MTKLEYPRHYQYDNRYFIAGLAEQIIYNSQIDIFNTLVFKLHEIKDKIFWREEIKNRVRRIVVEIKNEKI